MSADKKPRSDSNLKTLPPEQQEMIVSWCDQKGVGYKGAATRCRLDLNVHTSKSSLQEFYSWYRLRQRFQAASTRAQEMEQYLSTLQNHNLTSEQIREFGQMVFMKESLEAQNVKSFVALGRLNLSQQKLEHERERFKANLRTKLEAGLEALFEEIKGNAKAVEIYKQLEAALAPTK